MKTLFRSFKIVALIALYTALALTFVHSASAAPTAQTFYVNSTGDDSDAFPGNTECKTAGGYCTLRAAIEESNALVGDDTINFNLAGCPCTIAPSYYLPTLTDDGTTINGYSQSGSSVNTSKKGMNAKIMIKLSGLSAGDAVNGLYITGGQATIKGLEIWAFQGQGISIGTNGSNDIEGNLIHENAYGGIYIASNDNVIGQDVPAGRNAIYSNGGHGMQLWGQYTYIHNNLIGIGPNGGNVATGNTYTGIAINTSHNQVYKNRIAFNHNSGVVVTSGLYNTIYLNSIFSNSQFGIDLGNNGITQNDGGTPPDTDTGANNLQNFPVINSAVSATKTIKGKLFSTPSKLFSIYFYRTTTCDANGFGEGQKYIGTVSVSTNAKGVVKFSKTTKKFAPGVAITATAQGSDGSSEFSECFTAQ